MIPTGVRAMTVFAEQVAIEVAVTLTVGAVLGFVSELMSGSDRDVVGHARCRACRRQLRAPHGKAATYAYTGTAIAFIISELPGERAEALFIAMAALVPTAGEQSVHRIRDQAACRAVFSA